MNYIILAIIIYFILKNRSPKNKNNKFKNKKYTYPEKKDNNNLKKSKKKKKNNSKNIDEFKNQVESKIRETLSDLREKEKNKNKKNNEYQRIGKKTKNTYDNLHEDIEVDKVIDLKDTIEDDYEIESSDENRIDFDAKQAFIYSEIFNRKY